MVQISGKDEKTVDDLVELDIFEGYMSPDVQRAKNHKRVFNVCSETSRALALLVQYQAFTEMLIGYFNITARVGGTPTDPILFQDISGAMENFGNAGLYFTIGVILWYGGRWLKNKYEENKELLNLLTSKREEKRLDYFLEKREIS